MPVGWPLLIANLQVSELETLGNQKSIWTTNLVIDKVTDNLMQIFSSYVNEGLALGQLRGNRFAITLRYVLLDMCSLLVPHHAGS
jgi:hypothetical protein